MGLLRKIDSWARRLVVADHREAEQREASDVMTRLNNTRDLVPTGDETFDEAMERAKRYRMIKYRILHGGYFD